MVIQDGTLEIILLFLLRGVDILKITKILLWPLKKKENKKYLCIT